MGVREGLKAAKDLLVQPCGIHLTRNGSNCNNEPVIMNKEKSRRRNVQPLPPSQNPPLKRARKKIEAPDFRLGEDKPLNDAEERSE
jgi:hypothetical protein